MKCCSNNNNNNNNNRHIWKVAYTFIAKENTHFKKSFGLILQNRKLICVIGTVQSYLGFWGERLNFGITVAEIQPKVWERRRKRWKEKMLNFDNSDTEFPLPSSATRTWSAREKIKIKKLTNELWQCHCRNRGINFFF